MKVTLQQNRTLKLRLGASMKVKQQRNPGVKKRRGRKIGRRKEILTGKEKERKYNECVIINFVLQIRGF